MNCIRGSVTGNVVAFDKHFNVLMVDVVETYSRRYIGEKDKLHGSDARGDEKPGVYSGDGEEYGVRVIGEGDETTNLLLERAKTNNLLSPNEVEISRRLNGHGSSIKRRKLKETVMIHGACVVSCYVDYVATKCNEKK